MTIRIVDFQSYKDAINKLDEFAMSENTNFTTIDFSYNDKSIAKRMAEFFEIADGGNPEWNV